MFVKRRPEKETLLCVKKLLLKDVSVLLRETFVLDTDFVFCFSFLY